MIDVEHGRWDEAATARAAGQGPARRRHVVRPAPSWRWRSTCSSRPTPDGRREVEADRQLCHQHLTGLIDAAPWLNVQARVALARDALIRGDRVRAAALLKEADAIVGALPGAVGVRRATRCAQDADDATRDRAKRFGLASLTTAEQRVLQLLPTHLSIAEIAERLYVSRNTVKSQTIAIYRKLGTSSRSGAVAIAVAAGPARHRRPPG